MTVNFVVLETYLLRLLGLELALYLHQILFYLRVLWFINAVNNVIITYTGSKKFIEYGPNFYVT